MFARGLAEPLRDAALDLSFDDHRINDDADVVHAPVAKDMNFAGFAIDLDFASVCAIAPSEIARVIHRAVLEPELHVGRIVGWMVRDTGDLAERHAPVSAGDGESPSANAMSPADASSRCAAIFLPFSMTFIAARSSAEPPTAMEREPNVPEP